MNLVELINQDDDCKSAINIDFANLKVSLDVYCLMLPNNEYDDDDDDDDENDDIFNKNNSSEQLHFPIISNSTTQSTSVTLQNIYIIIFIKTIFIHRKQTEDYENPFIYLSSSLPLRHAQGLAAFVAEVCIIILNNKY